MFIFINMHEIKDIIFIIHTSKRIFMTQGKKVMLNISSSKVSLFW